MLEVGHQFVLELVTSQKVLVNQSANFLKPLAGSDDALWFSTFLPISSNY